MSCLLNGESTSVYRTPDATFGLATFEPEDYEDDPDSYELDRDRLYSLMLHPRCEIISDSQLGRPSLVFPFAVYEAKGWSGDCRDARHQACSGAAAYLDMLHSLGQHPAQKEFNIQVDGTIYQSSGDKAQVFAFTSFGAHWHILVGYRRRRAKNEHAGTPGLSENVYVWW